MGGSSSYLLGGTCRCQLQHSLLERFKEMTKELRTEVLIVGGGLGGCAAALAVCRSGRTAIVTEPTDWIGGQLTSQAVPPDEHGWIEQFGATASYRRLRTLVRQYYRDHYRLTRRAQDDPYLNPGLGWVSPLCHEPRVALAVLEAMLAPYRTSGLLTILQQHVPVSTETAAGDRIAAVTLENRLSGGQLTITADYVLDATELGDLLPLAGAEFVTGQESQSQTGEPGAPDVARPQNSQAMTVCFAVDHMVGENHTIDRPAEYEFWRDFVPPLNPPWAGKLVRLTGLSPRTLEPVHYRFDPTGEPPVAFSGLWTYRRILAREQFTPGSFPSDICLINWPMTDYLLGDLCTCDTEQAKKHIERAKQLSLSLLYWLQTEYEREDGGRGLPGLRLRPDIVGTADGLAKAPYIRESRRIEAEFTVCQQHLSADLREGKLLAEAFDDSVGIGSYRIDLHPTTGGDNYFDVPTLPFQIPLGALIPVRMENLLPAAKNLGVTHITNGCYRLHPVEWSVGEAAGALSCFCLAQNSSPRGVLHNNRQLVAFQDSLVQQGIELQWPSDLNLQEGEPHRHGMNGPGGCDHNRQTLILPLGGRFRSAEADRFFK